MKKPERIWSLAYNNIIQAVDLSRVMAMSYNPATLQLALITHYEDSHPVVVVGGVGPLDLVAFASAWEDFNEWADAQDCEALPMSRRQIVDTLKTLKREIAEADDGRTDGPLLTCEMLLAKLEGH